MPLTTRSTGPARFVPFPSPEDAWVTYIHLENAHDLGAAEVERYARYEKPVFLGEDRYEQDLGPPRDPANMRVWQRRLFWSWLVSGGSANYGGRWMVLHPYSYTQTKGRFASIGRPGKEFRTTVGLVGLDSVPFIKRFFDERNIDLGRFTPDHQLARDPTLGGDAPAANAPRLARREWEEILAYHPNARGKEASADVDPARTARLWIDLTRATGTFRAAWYRAADGVFQEGGAVKAGAPADIEAPWRGADVVLWLRR
jgi:hypothetical protein